MHVESLSEKHASFEGMSDEDLVISAKQGSRASAEHLLTKYRHLVEGKARAYYLAGADREDVVQEGMIGLYKAIRDFRNDRVAGFRAFADICVTRQIITAVKTSTRQKHVPLNRYISLHRSAAEYDSETALIDILPDHCVVDPEKLLLDADMAEYLHTRVYSELSGLESKVLGFYLQGMSYQEMAATLCCRTKAVDNALQRAKRKISERIERY